VVITAANILHGQTIELMLPGLLLQSNWRNLFRTRAAFVQPVQWQGLSIFKCASADSSARDRDPFTQSAASTFFLPHCTTSDVSGAQMTTGRPAREYSVSFVAKHVSVRRRCAASKKHYD